LEKLQLVLSLIEGTNDLIHSIEPDGSFEFVNRAWLETLGYSDEDLKELHLEDILFPGYLKKHQDLISQVLKGKIETDVEVVLITKTGDTRVVEGSVFPRREEDKIVSDWLLPGHHWSQEDREGTG
jgi:PAS domain S-box-containing protein